MEPLLAVVVGVLTAGAVYSMLGRNLVRFLFGIMLLSNAANLLIFASGRTTLGMPPLIDTAQDQLSAAAANPLPQALILTAIVISFGLLVFALILTYRAYRVLGTVDTDMMRAAEPLEDDGTCTAPAEDRR